MIPSSPKPENQMTEFEKDLTALINRHSMESASNTPDFMLASYLMACLDAFTQSVQQRETWYGRDARPSATAIDL